MVRRIQPQRPLLLLAAAFALGSSIGADLGREAAAALMALVALCLAAAPAARRVWAHAAILAASVAVGAAGAAVEGQRYAEAPLHAWLEDGANSKRAARLEGTLRDEPSYRNDRWRLDLDLHRAGALEADWIGRVLISVAGLASLPDLPEGGRLSVWARLRPPRQASNPEGYDPAGWARRQGVHAYGSAKSALLVSADEKTLAPGPGWLSHARRTARKILRDALPRSDARGVVLALVTGDRSGVDESVSEALRLSGTFHLLAISGAHVAVVAGLLLWLTALARASPRVAAVVVVIGLLAYASFVGGAVPVRRAALMAIVVVLGRAIELDADIANLLGLVALVLLAIQPSAIGSISFQLSFAATLGIATLTPPLLRLLPRLPLRLDVALAASAAAQISLLPLLLVHFNRLAPAGLLVNVVAAPLAATVMVAGFACVLAGALGAWGVGVLGVVAWLAADLLIACARAVSQIGWLDVWLPHPTLTTSAAYYTGIAFAFRGPGRRALGIGLLVASLATVVWVRRDLGDGRLHLTALDVGQGDALVIRSPGGRTAVVDAGPATRWFDAGERVVAPYLWALGVRRVDLLVLTHSHGDHVGGAGFLLDHFDVGEVWEGYATPGSSIYRRLERSIRKNGARRLAVGRGVRRLWDGVRIEVLSPGARSGPARSVANDDSLVLELQLGSARILLPGDISQAIEAELDPGRVAVLKLPHHGSRTSSSWPFVRATAPRLAIATVGSRNPFSHPHPEVVERYEAVGARMLRTDRDGAVMISTDGRRVWLHTMREPRPRSVS